MGEIRQVLIVGAGIGGLTLAVALGRRGIAAQVVELAPDYPFYGVGIIQPGNALRALDTIGLLEPCRVAGFATDDYRMFEADGTAIAGLKLLRIAGPGHPAVNTLPRPALHRILSAAAVELGTRIRFGLTVDALEQSDTAVSVTLSDGTHESYDLVVGADGIRSHVRRMLFGDRFPPQFAGQGVWRFTTRRPPEIDYQAMYFGVGAKAGLMPMTQDLMYLLLVTNEPDNPRMPQERLHTLLAQRLQPFGGEIAKVRGALTDPSEVIYVPVEEVILPPPWHCGRVVLIGDAAHASSPHIAQGATMAIEDAVVLAELVAGADDVETMLERFTDRRYERCRFVQETSRQVGLDGNLDDPQACRERNARMRKAFANPQPRPHELRLAEPI